MCQKKEKPMGLTSMRKKGDILISPSSSNYPFHIKRLDISFGNTCNLDCVMCRPDFSSKWNKVVETMPDDIKRGTEKKLVKNTTMTYDQIDTILDKVGKKLESIVIKGGEPLYDKKAQYFLNKLSDINPNFQVDYAFENYLSPFLLGKKNYIKIAQSNPYTKGWKYKKPSKQHYKLHENYKQFWNKHRGMDWDNIDVSKY